MSDLKQKEEEIMEHEPDGNANWSRSPWNTFHWLGNKSQQTGDQKKKKKTVQITAQLKSSRIVISEEICSYSGNGYQLKKM